MFARHVTGIEIGGTRCVLVRVRPGASALEVSQVYGLDGAEALPAAGRGPQLREIRRRLQFPKPAAVVAWPGALEAGDPRALLEAGFDVREVLSPPAALARLAGQRPALPGRAAVAWLALNRDGAAIAIVVGPRLLYSRTLEWSYRPGSTARAELLQRYLLVATLAPEVRHGIEVVGREQGIAVEAVVTCGDLPDLRSLTMPLIEELDMEVETLDSLDGLEIVAPASRADLADRAPSLRLAGAAAAGALAARQLPVSPIWLSAAAAAAILAAAWGFWQWRGTDSQPPAPVPVRSAPADPANPAAGADAGPPGGAPAVPSPVEEGQPAATMGQVPRRPPVGSRIEGILPPEPATATAVREPAAAPAQPAAVGTTPPRTRRPPAPLDTPIPRVNSILVAPDRRLAVVEGEIVREGDAVGPRVLERIEPHALLLREPSGRLVRVPIRRLNSPLR